MTTENGYLNHKTRIKGEVKFTIPQHMKFDAEACGMDVAEAVFSETVQRFAAVLPHIPYIGGDENILTENLHLAAAMLDPGNERI